MSDQNVSNNIDYDWPLTFVNWFLISVFGTTIDAWQQRYSVFDLSSPWLVTIGVTTGYLGFAAVITAVIYVVNPNRRSMRIKRIATIVGWCLLAISSYPLLHSFFSASDSEQVESAANGGADSASPVQPNAINIQGEWACARKASNESSRLLLASDGSVASSISNEGPLVYDPWLHWYPPTEKNGGQKVALLRIQILNPQRIVIQYPNNSISNCRR